MSRLIEVEDLDLVNALAAQTREFINERLAAEAEKTRRYVDMRFDALHAVAATLRNAQPRLRVLNG